MKVIIVGLGKMGQDYIEKVAAHGNHTIIGIDRDQEKLASVRAKYPEVELYDSFTVEATAGTDAAIVATNTPSHHTVIGELYRRGVTQFLCEKPLALTLQAVDEKIAPVTLNADIYTGFLMNFSPAIAKVQELMRNEELVLTEASVTWGKNRFGDKRPTAGDLEDETVHGIGIVHSIFGATQSIVEVEVVGFLTYPSFASPEAQQRAHALDPSFPVRPNASTMALERIYGVCSNASCVIHSSFVHPVQTRKVTAVLAKTKAADEVVYSVEMNFDQKVEGKIVDELVITKLANNTKEEFSFECDKLGEQTTAFLNAVQHKDLYDGRLTGFMDARAAVGLSEAILESMKTSQFVKLGY